MRLRLALVLLFAFLASPALGERRVALVFGIDKYQSPQRSLKNAVNDARAIEDSLSVLGFEVFSHSNRPLARMKDALADFVEVARGADVALIYFSGHGIEIAGENRILPADTDSSSLERLKATTLPLDDLAGLLLSVADTGIVIVDACRNDPFGAVPTDTGRGAVSMPKDVANTVLPSFGRMGQADNLLFAFAAAPGKTALDGDGTNSPFSAALVKYLVTPGLDIRSIFTLVQQEVYDRTRGQQLPYVENGLPRFVFTSSSDEILSERERILLAMADITPGMRHEIETIASEYDMPLVPLYATLIENELTKTLEEGRQNELRRAAEAYSRMRDLARWLGSEDEEISRLREAAIEKMDIGALQEADDLLRQAQSVTEGKRQIAGRRFVDATVEFATGSLLRGSVAEARLRSREALNHYVAAVDALHQVQPIGPQRQVIGYLLEALGSSARLQLLLGNLAGAKEHSEERLRLAQMAYDADRTIETVTELGRAKLQLAQTRRAQDGHEGTVYLYRDAQDLVREFAPLWASQSAPSVLQSDIEMWLGDVLMDLGEYQAAVVHFETAHKIDIVLGKGDGSSLELRRRIAISAERVADSRTASGDRSGALETYTSLLNDWQRFTVDSDQSPDTRYGLSKAHDRVGSALFSLDRFDEALDHYRFSLGLREDLAQRDPENTVWKRSIAASYRQMGDVLLALGNLDGATDALQRAVDSAEALAYLDPRNDGWQRELVIYRERLALTYSKRGDEKTALATLREALAEQLQLAASFRVDQSIEEEIALTHLELGDLWLANADLAEAGSAYESAVATYVRLASLPSSRETLRESLARSYDKTAYVRQSMGDLSAAARAYRSSHAIWKELANGGATTAKRRWELALSYYNLAGVGVDPKSNLEKSFELASKLDREGALEERDAIMLEIIRNDLERAN